MAIHYIDNQGNRAQLADRAALVEALRQGRVSGGTRVYVPAKNGFVPLEEVFDIARLREGDTSRKAPPAPVAKPAARAAARGPASKASASPWLAAALIAAAGLVFWQVQDRMNERREQEAQSRRQIADDLSQVAAQMKSNAADPPAAGASAAPPAATPPKGMAALKTPVAQLIADHLAEVQALSSAHEQAIDRIAGDQLMTPGSLSTRAGIAANRDKLTAMTRSIDTYFAAVKRSKQEYLRKAEQLGAQHSAAGDENMRRVFDFLERAHQANLHMVKTMGDMNDFAAQHHPTLVGGGLVFNSQPDLARWRQLSGVLVADQQQLQRLGEEGRQIENKSATDLQQQIGRLRQPG